MKLVVTVSIAAALTVAAHPAAASLELARKRACAACHAPDKKLVGPALADIARKYAGRKDAAAAVADSIRNGSSGKWGPIPMPAQPKLTEAELKALTLWILDGAK